MHPITVRKRPGEGGDSLELTTEPSYAADIFTRDNPRSVINLLPGDCQAKIFNAASTRPDLFRMAEKPLRKLCKPTPTDERLRLAFWNEYDRAQTLNSDMRIVHIFAGICSKQYFEQYYLSEPVNVAWMLCTPTNYVIALKEMLVRGQDQLRDILEQDVVDEDGKVDVKLGELILKIYTVVENRLKGTTIQRSEIRGEIKSVNLQMTGQLPEASASEAGQAVAKALAVGTLEEIEAKLARVRAAQRKQDREAAEAGVVQVEKNE